LKTLQADLLEEANVVVDGKAPFVVVVIQVKGVPHAPPAARHAMLVDVQKRLISAHGDGTGNRSRFEKRTRSGY
jgi:hypothetical protein